MVTDGVILQVRRTVNSWADLSALIESHCGGWIFRGVTDLDHKLIPKIGRPGTRKDVRTGASRPFSAGEERLMIDEFRRLGRPYLPTYNISDLELLAIGQHHGMPTRLLDWTESPLVAAFFAAENAATGRRPPAIYAVRDLPVLSGTERLDDIREVSIYRPPHVSARIPAQRGLFTVHPSPARDELAPPRSEVWVLENKSRTGFWLKRVLDQCGFNRASMFPDLDGLASHLGWRYKWGV
jgi:hypothetical protein